MRSAPFDLLMSQTDVVSALWPLLDQKKIDMESVFFRTDPQTYGVYSNVFRTAIQIEYWGAYDINQYDKLSAGLEKLAYKLR